MVMSVERMNGSPGKLHWVGGKVPVPPGDSIEVHPPLGLHLEVAARGTQLYHGLAPAPCFGTQQCFWGPSFSTCPGGRDLAPKLVGRILADAWSWGETMPGGRYSLGPVWRRGCRIYSAGTLLVSPCHRAGINVSGCPHIKA